MRPSVIQGGALWPEETLIASYFREAGLSA